MNKIYTIIALLIIFSFISQTALAEDPLDDLQKIKKIESFWQKIMDIYLKLQAIGEKMLNKLSNDENVPPSSKKWISRVKIEFIKEIEEMKIDIKKNIFKPFSYFR